MRSIPVTLNDLFYRRLMHIRYLGACERRARQKGRVVRMTIKAMRWVTGGVAAAMAAGGLAVPAWAGDTKPASPALAVSGDQWHPGWCNKDENGYSVLVDFLLVPAKDRGGLAPDTTKLTDAHVKDGWLVRCHKGLEPVKDAGGDARKDADAWRESANWAAGVGVPAGLDDGITRILGVTEWSKTSDGKRINMNTVTVVPGGDGSLPPWPDNVDIGGNYPGKPETASFNANLIVPEKPVKGMTVEIAAYPKGDDEYNMSYVLGDKPNRPEHRPQYADAPAPTSPPTPTPTPTPSPTVTPTPTPTPTSAPTPTVTPRPTSGGSGSPVRPGAGDHSRSERPWTPAPHGGHPGLPDPSGRGGFGGSGVGDDSAPVALPATGA